MNSQHLGGVVASIKSSSNNEPQPVSLSDELRHILASIDNPEEEETIEENLVDVNEQLETPENVSVDEHLETPEEISTEHEMQTPEDVRQGNIVSGDVSQELRDILKAIEYEEGEVEQDVPPEQDHATNGVSNELDEDQLVAKGLEEFLKKPGGLAKHESDIEAGKDLAAWLNQNK